MTTAPAVGIPVAAVLLAVELLLFEWRPRSLIPVTFASVTAAVLRSNNSEPTRTSTCSSPPEICKPASRVRVLPTTCSTSRNVRV